MNSDRFDNNYYKVSSKAMISFPTVKKEQYPLQTIFNFTVNTRSIKEIRYGDQIMKDCKIQRQIIQESEKVIVPDSIQESEPRRIQESESDSGSGSESDSESESESESDSEDILHIADIMDYEEEDDG